VTDLWVCFGIGERVSVTLAKEIEGQVTAYCVRKNGYVTYEVTWINNGAVVTSWLTEDSIKRVTEQSGAGFSVKVVGA
jgi:hypothetical protein